MNNPEHFKSLFLKYRNNDISATEMEELYNYFDGVKDPVLLRKFILEHLEQEDHIPSLTEEDQGARIKKAAWPVIAAHIQQSKDAPIKRINPYKRWLPYAAIFVMMMAALMYFVVNRTSDPVASSALLADIPPGSNKATLILDNGKTLELDSTRSGIMHTDNQITYDDGSVIEQQSVQYATLRVPVSGQYQVVLSDGTKVWLNATSSLRYPVQFKGAERVVTLTGEGYFEVAKDSKRPFIVETAEQRLTVLGTKFNLTAYHPENIITTLVEGSVALRINDAANKTLKPGQQAIWNDKTIQVQEVETSDYTAWTSNLFVFNDKTLQETFDQLERWYDITFEYTARSGQKRIYAEIPRDRTLSEVLEMLAQTSKIKFERQGRRIKVH